jgi:S-(hydroxymethyl)glutathione dehydrogenase/alcohol dehydrogenase
VLVGIAPGTSTAEVEITRLVRRSLRIIGNYGGRVRTDLPEVVRLAAAGDYHPHLTVTRTYALDDVADAFQALEAGQITGRALICP